MRAFKAVSVPAVRPALAVRRAAPRTVTCAAEAPAPPPMTRFRLTNIGPAKGSRKRKQRKGRGHSAGQGQSCGFGMRGQNARSGPSTRPGFEGGQTPLYRRLPKLKGIAGGMKAGVPSNVTINLRNIAEKFSEGEEVSLDTLTAKRMLNPSGRDRRLGLKVLSEGELPFPLTIKAECFSAAAKEKIEAAGGTVVEVPKKEKWTREKHEAKMAELGDKKPAKRRTGRPKKVWPKPAKGEKFVNPGKRASRTPEMRAKRRARMEEFIKGKIEERKASEKAAKQGATDA